MFPSGRPLYFPNKPWALSSTTAIEWRAAIFLDRIHLATDAGIVDSHDRAGTLRNQRFHAGLIDVQVSGRISAKTGRAPRRAKALAIETKVNDGMMTSSPG